MSEAGEKFVLVSDDDGHWYVCPAENKAEAEAYLEAVGDYWKHRAAENVEPPEDPGYLVPIDGPHRLVFTGWLEERP